MLAKGAPAYFRWLSRSITGLAIKKAEQFLFNKSSGFYQQTACSIFFCLVLFNLPYPLAL
jgi:hypothetical protein